MQTFFFDSPFVFNTGVKGKPLQAEFEIITSRRDADRQLKQKIKTGNFYRASDGVSRLEIRSVGEAVETPREILIHDPLTQTIYFIDPDGKTFFKESLVDEVEADENRNEDETAAPEHPGDELGHRTIEGFACRGFHLTRMNGAAIEYWVSETLGDALFSRTIREGEENLLRLFNISQTEPQRSLFVVPEDYQNEGAEDEE
jgi:Domain of unknown function (DUF4412)